MRGTKRKAIAVTEEFDALTLLKPFSDEYRDFLIVIHEDAYGEFSGKLTPITEIRKNFGGSDEEFNQILQDLGK